MSGWYPSDISRPTWPHFEDDPRAEMEEERAAFADWRRDRSADRVPGDDQDEAPLPATLDYAEREEARAVALRKMFGVVS